MKTNTRKRRSIKINSKEDSSGNLAQSPSPRQSRFSEQPTENAPEQQKATREMNLRVLHKLRPSMLSSEHSESNSFRGFMNLGVLVMAVSNIHLIISNFQKYGLLVRWVSPLKEFFGDPYRWPSLSLACGLLFWPLTAFLFEKFLSTKKVYNSKTKNSVFVFYFIFICSLAVIPIWVIHATRPHPGASMANMFIVTILLLKLISYGVVNHEERESHLRRRRHLPRDLSASADQLAAISGDKISEIISPTSPTSNSALAAAEETPLLNSTSDQQTPPNSAAPADDDNENQGFKMVQEEVRAGEGTEKLIVWPSNVTLSNMVYFLFAPTLVYELNYPRTDGIRKRWLVRRVSEAAFFAVLIIVVVEQYIRPLLRNSVLPFTDLHLSAMIERLLKLSVPNLLVWLLGFYLVFHLGMNVVAEVLRFGDRQFYTDWWNATTLEYFWRSWNIPVHRWVLRHLYTPITNRGFSRAFASFMVFLVSAMFHELIVSVPFHTLKWFSFIGMMSQVPLALFTRKFCRGKQIGNLIFWVSIMLGQPLGVLLYYTDFQAVSSAH